MDERLSPFQRRCAAAVHQLFSDLGVSADSEVEVGQSETYLVARVARVPPIEVYIYDDEAGFFLGGKWQPFEAVDFDSQEQLITALTGALRKNLSNS